MTYVIAEPCVDVKDQARAARLGALDVDHPLIAAVPPAGEG
ncbi:hypothetical protein [Actinomadura sp. 3N508]